MYYEIIETQRMVHFVSPALPGTGSLPLDHSDPSLHGLGYFEGWSIPGIPKIDPKCKLNIDITLVFEEALSISTNLAWF